MTVLSASLSLTRALLTSSPPVASDRNGITIFFPQFTLTSSPPPPPPTTTRHAPLTLTTKQPKSRHTHSKRRRALVLCSVGGREVYQPFRPPSQDQEAGAGSVEEKLQILRERRGLWHEYAVHIPALTRLGFDPPSIEEATSVPGVEQNQIVVASQVRLSLVTTGLDKAVLDFFDAGGAAILYELRILSNEQRKSAAEFAVRRNMEVKDARDLARAMKDYNRRKKEEGWSAFSSSPGDSMAFACYRTSKEYSNTAHEYESILRRGLSFAESKAGRTKILKALGEKVEEEEEVSEAKQEEVIQLSVVELDADENAGLVLLAVAAPNPSSVEAAPYRGALAKGPFRIYSSEVPWKSWVPIPAWESIVTAAAPIALYFSHSKLLSTKKGGVQDPLLVIVDKGSLDVEENSFYVMTEENEEDVLAIQPGSVLIQKNRKPLAKVVVCLKPPRPMPDIQDAWE